MANRLIRVNKDDFKYLQDKYSNHNTNLTQMPYETFVADREKKMTRSEAYQKIRGFLDVGKTNDFLKALEALGLIKFDDEPASIKECIEVKTFPYLIPIDEAIKAVQSAGYTVIKI